MNSEQTVIEYIGDEKTPGSAKVLINGTPIHGVSRISFEHKACEIPEVVLGIGGTEMDMHLVKTIIKTGEAKVVIRRE